jgi:hypothetical protein
MSGTEPQTLQFLSSRPSCRIIRQAFVRGIGVIYLIAIVSLWTQIQGLVGSHGLLPVRHYLDLLRQVFPHDAFRQNPSLIWLSPSDGFLNFLCGAGVALSLLVIAGFVQAPALALLWVIYLSLTVVGQDFLNFQWDALLLEAGLLTVFFAPTQLLPRLSRQREPSRIILWLIRWLLFRLMFLSGLVKLLSGDSCWRDGTAMNFHYLTQPLPAWTSYWAYQLPGWFQWLSVWIMFGIELLSPFLIFAGDVVDLFSRLLARFFRTGRPLHIGRRSRQSAFVFLMSLQLLITATGNFGFFNLLAMLLCVSLLDDDVLPKWLRRRILPMTFTPEQGGAKSRDVAGAPESPRPAHSPPVTPDTVGATLSYRGPPDRPRTRMETALFWARLLGASLFAAVIFFLTTLTGVLECIRTANYQAELPEALQTIVGWVEPFRSTNGYGLFRVMTRERNEIIIEGSDDGEIWKPYEFKYKPGDPFRMPRFCTPHMPRLDWQMWFGVFGRADQNRWFIPLLKRLLAGEPHVLALLDKNPFPNHPPKYIRAIEYNYRFAPVSAEGRWWNRSNAEGYFPAVTLQEMRQESPEPGVDTP